MIWMCVLFLLINSYICNKNILVKLADGTFRAFSQRCTHLLCPVHFKPEDESLYCPCHNGSFNAKDGSVQFGPPPKPLPQYKVKVDDGVIWITGAA